MPPNLVDNAAILGTLCVVTGALFLLDMGGPKAKKDVPPAQIQQGKNGKTTAQQNPDIDVRTSYNGERAGRSITEQVYDIERVGLNFFK